MATDKTHACAQLHNIVRASAQVGLLAETIIHNEEKKDARRDSLTRDDVHTRVSYTASIR